MSIIYLRYTFLFFYFFIFTLNLDREDNELGLDLTKIEDEIN